MSEVESQEKAPEEEVPAKAKEEVPSGFPIRLGPRYNLEPVDFDRGIRNRVKLYICKNTSSWDDAGTGHVGFSQSSDDGVKAMVFRLETSEENWFESMVNEAKYQKQQETLIVWKEDSVMLAFSFQEQEGADEFYAELGTILGKEPDADVGLDESEPSLSDEEDEEEMPPLQLARLFEVELYMKRSLSSSAAGRDKIARYFESEGQISKLIDLFAMLEDMEDTTHLKILHSIVKSLILMNRPPLIKLLLDDENLRDVIGMLEYDPLREQPAKHRVFLYEKARFREVLPIEDDELRAKIHKVYRVQFIKDQCMPPPSIFEENPTVALSTYLNALRLDISLTLRKYDFAGVLISELKKENIAEERRRDLMLLFTEFMELSLAPGTCQRERTFSTVFSKGIIAASYPCISTTDPAIQTMAVETIFKLVAHDPATVVNYLHQQGVEKSSEDTLTSRLALLMFADKDPHNSMTARVVEIFRHLLVPDTPYHPEQERFAVDFYRDAVPCIITRLLKHFEGGRLKPDSHFLADKVNHVLELLKFCVQQHVSRFRPFIVENDLLTVLLGLLQSKHHFLAITAVKLLRTVIATEDVLLLSYIVRKDLFAPVVACLKKQRFRNNLLFSVVLELFEYIALDHVKIPLDYVMEKYGGELEGTMGKVFGIMQECHQTSKKIDEEQKARKEQREVDEKWFDEKEDSPPQPIDNAEPSDSFKERPKAASSAEDTSVFNSAALRPKLTFKFQIQSVEKLPSKETSKEPVVVEPKKPLVEYDDDSSDSDDEKEDDPPCQKESTEKSAVPVKPSTPIPISRGSKRSSTEWANEKENEAKKPCN